MSATRGGSYEGGVLGERVNGGRAGAAIEVTPMALVARTSEGEILEIRLSTVSLEIGGASGRMVFCRDPDRSLTFFSEDGRLLTQLAATGPLAVQRRAATLQGRLRRGRDAKLVGWGVACAAIVALALAAPSALRSAVRHGVSSIPYAVDEQVGKAALRVMDLHGSTIANPIVQAAVSEMAQRLAPHRGLSEARFNVQVVRRDEANAFALPGGSIVLYTGLLTRAQSGEEVAGVLAHEMAHVTQRHGLQRIAQSLGVVGAVQLLLGDTGGLIALGAELFTAASVNKYSREQESAADREAVRMLLAAGLSPEALAALLDRLASQGQAVPDSLSWLGTHPDPGARLAAIREQAPAAERAAHQPLTTDWAAVGKALEGRLVGAPEPGGANEAMRSSPHER